MKSFLVPDFIYVIFQFSSILVAIAALILLIRGIKQKAPKKDTILWIVILVLAVVMFILTITGVIAADPTLSA